MKNQQINSKYDVKAATCWQTEEPNMSCASWTSAELLLCTKTTCSLNVMMDLWNKSQWFAASVRLISELWQRSTHQLFSVEMREQTLWDQIWCSHTLMNEDHRLYTCCDAVSWNPALFPADMNTTTTVVFTSTQTHDDNKLVAPLIGWLLSLCLSLCPILKSVTILLSQLHWGKQQLRRLKVYRRNWIFALILTVFITIQLKPAGTDSNTLLTSESPVCSLDSPENHTAASLLNPAGCCYSGPDLSD